MKLNRLKSKIIWKNKYGYKLHEDRFVHNSREYVYNFISRNPGYVAILAVDKDQKVYLVNSYRYPIQKMVYELPMGFIDKNESPLEAAKRELKEETGLKALSWKKIDIFTIAPGFMNMKCHLFLATHLKIGDKNVGEDELGLQSVKTHINKIKDSKEPITKIAYLLLRNRVLQIEKL